MSSTHPQNKMVSEETPLLISSAAAEHGAVYRRFSPSTKRRLVAMVSFSGLLPRVVSGTFVPSIPQIAADLDSTGRVISIAVSLSVFAAGLGGLASGTYSTFYGRRPVYLVGLPLLAIGSLGVALATSVPQLMVWRFVQSIGASLGNPVGVAVIGDIYKLEERGQALGFYFASILLGPALAPLAGGVATHYSSWRAMQSAIGVAGLISFIIMLLYFPETSHPGARGIDKLQANGGANANRTFVLLNPIKSLALLRSPVLLATTIAGSAILLTDYVLLTPLAYTIGARYNITNEAVIGACFLPCGLGNMTGALVSGYISDRIIIRCKEKRGGVWYPEDRLRVALIGALVFVPLSVLLCGLVTTYIEGPLGLTLNLVCLFMNGFGVDIVLGPISAYIVDIMHSRSAEGRATNQGFRALLLSTALPVVLQMIDKYGMLATNVMSAAIAWVGFGILWATIRYGEQMRSWVKMGYSTVDNN